MLVEANPRLAAALSYAARGWYVFPCAPRLKVPATPNGHNDATLDPEKLRAWWRVNPNYNVAIATGPSNLLVIDVDPNGETAWAETLIDDAGLSAIVNTAPVTRTPRGGVHVYMTGRGPTTASKFAPGIDTRGEGGYVLAPPSYVDDGKSKGRYEGTPEAGNPPPVYAPLLARIGETVAVEMPRVPENERKWDEPETLTRAHAWLEGLAAAGDVAVEGAGGDQRTYEICCKLLEMAISPDTAHGLLVDLWNPHCSPPWDSEELLAKVRNAWTYGQETKGVKAERPIAEQFKHLLDAADTIPNSAVKPLPPRYQVKTYGEAMHNRPPLEWIIPELLPRKGIGILFGKPETLKTFLLLDLALSIATGYGRNWWEGQREPQAVLFLAGESPDALLTKRVPAWLAANLLPGLYALVRDNFLVVEGVPPLEMTEYYQGIMRVIQERGFKPVLVCVDTLTRAMAGKDENSSKDASWTTNKLEEISRQLTAFVIAVHHSGKDGERGARGSSVWHGNTDLMLEVERPLETELSVLVHLKKLKEGGKTGVPLKFDGAIYNDAPALTRDWDFKPETDVTEKTKNNRDTEEWYGSPAIIAELSKGPMNIHQLAASLANRFGINPAIVKKKLRRGMEERYKAWVPNGETWVIPDTLKVQVREEEF